AAFTGESHRQPHPGDGWPILRFAIVRLLQDGQELGSKAGVVEPTRNACPLLVSQLYLSRTAQQRLDDQRPDIRRVDNRAVGDDAFGVRLCEPLRVSRI